MQLIIRIFCVLLVLISGVAQAQIKDQAAVEKIMADIDEQLMKRDINGLLKHFSANAKITINSNMRGQQKTLTMNTREYADYFRQMAATVTDYRYQRTETNIDVSEDRKKAVVQTKANETTKMRTTSMTGTSAATIIFERINGRTLITSLAATANIR